MGGDEKKRIRVEVRWTQQTWVVLLQGEIVSTHEAKGEAILAAIRLSMKKSGSLTIRDRSGRRQIYQVRFNGRSYNS